MLCLECVAGGRKSQALEESRHHDKHLKTGFCLASDSTNKIALLGGGWRAINSNNGRQIVLIKIYRQFHLLFIEDHNHLGDLYLVPK